MTFFYAGPRLENEELAARGITDPREDNDCGRRTYWDIIAFRSGIGVCYIPDLSFACYTRADFLRLVGGSARRAQVLFYACTWQHPETLLAEEEHDHCLFGEQGDAWYLPPGTPEEAEQKAEADGYRDDR